MVNIENLYSIGFIAGILVLLGVSYFIFTDLIRTHKFVLTGAVTGLDFELGDAFVAIQLQNNGFEHIILNRVEIVQLGCAYSENVTMQPRSTIEIQINCPLMKDSINTDVRVTYTAESGLSHTQTGKLIST